MQDQALAVQPVGGASRPTIQVRLAYFGLAVLAIGLGLLWRQPVFGLSFWVAKYGGSVLWGSMLYFGIRCLWPQAPLLVSSLIAAAVAAGGEFSQLISTPWLDAFRATTPGALLLGRTFAWADIPAYWVGIVAAVVADFWLVRKRLLRKSVG